MRLTNYMRDAFVNGVMADVPSVDYDEQAHKIVRAKLDALFPGDRNALGAAGWLNQRSVYLPGVLRSPYTSAPEHKILEQHPETWAALTEIAAKHKAQRDQRDALRDKLKGCAYSASTRKALAEMLPEFEKYLPADAPAASRALPVVQNVVADFMRAGWPSSKGEVTK